MAVSRIYLIGFMGCGKTHTGQKLAQLLDYQFIDLDEQIVLRNNGKSVTEIFAQEGEAFFRAEEAEVLRATGLLERAVISCGGGAPCFHNNMDWIRANGFSIYLKTDAKILAKRLLRERHKRPLLAGTTADNMTDFINAKLLERESWYQQAAFVLEQREEGLPVAEILAKRIKEISG